jgi:hypothetical protein
LAKAKLRQFLLVPLTKVSGNAEDFYFRQVPSYPKHKAQLCYQQNKKRR